MEKGKATSGLFLRAQWTRETPYTCSHQGLMLKRQRMLWAAASNSQLNFMWVYPAPPGEPETRPSPGTSFPGTGVLHLSEGSRRQTGWPGLVQQDAFPKTAKREKTGTPRNPKRISNVEPGLFLAKPIGSQRQDTVCSKRANRGHGWEGGWKVLPATATALRGGRQHRRTSLHWGPAQVTLWEVIAKVLERKPCLITKA